jgi:hypothetical protein
MRKIYLSLVLAFAVGIGILATGGTASAATDRRACVTAGEYASIQRNMSQTRLFALLDGHGVLLDTINNSYDDSYWVDGYEDWYWVDTSYEDPDTGEWIEDGYDDFDWVDGYWEGGYVSIKDTVRSFKKCPSFGSGRIGVNLDNYSGGRSSMHVYTKVRSNPWALVDWVYGATSFRSAAGAGAATVIDGTTHKVIPRG